MPIDVEKELEEANVRLPVVVPDSPMPLDIQLRTIALAVAQRHVGDTCVKEGGLYQQLKMDNKLGNVVALEDVVKAALVFERYLWGEWSKGIAENAINSISTEAAAMMEEEYKRKEQELRDEFKDEPPTRSHGGGKDV